MASCFISAPFDVNINALEVLIRSKGLTPFVSRGLPTVGLNLVRDVTSALSDSSIVIGVLQDQGPNDNVLFELGYAHALGKQILVVLPEKTVFPSTLTEFLFIRSGLENLEAVSFALDQVLAAQPPTKRRPKRPKDSSKAIGDRVDQLLIRLDSYATETELEMIIGDALQLAGVSTVAQSQQGDKRLDFAVWLDDLQSSIGNPLIIEVKRGIQTERQARELSEQFTAYMSKGTFRTALVLYDKGIASKRLNDISGNPIVLFLDIRDFLTQLRYKSFSSIVRELRNRVVHRSES